MLWLLLWGLPCTPGGLFQYMQTNIKASGVENGIPRGTENLLVSQNNLDGEITNSGCESAGLLTQ